MILLKGDLSADALQRSVGLLSAAACVVFATLNAAILLARGTSIYLILFQPAVFVILAMAVAFYLTGVIRHWTMQALQVVAYLGGGLATSVGATVGDLTSTLFAIYGLYLFNEYGDPGRRLVPSILITIFYLGVSVVLGETPTTTYSVINHFAFAGAVVGLYGLVRILSLDLRCRSDGIANSCIHGNDGAGGP